MGVGCGGMGEEVRGLRSINKKLQNSHGDVQYRKWSSQRTDTQDPWPWTMVWGLPDWVGVLGGGGAKGEKIRINIIAQSTKYNFKKQHIILGVQVKLFD